jgi:hydroxymethylbilane synthase
MLPFGSSIGTTSPRRRAMLLALRPDLEFVELRGNVDTRLRKWESGVCDALVLASAGLDRLEHTAHIHQRFSVDELTPAPGQGALALETRKPGHDDREKLVILSEAKDLLFEDFLARENAIYATIRALNCADAEYAVTAERAVLHALGSGCQLPLGAYAHRVDDQWHLHAMVVSPDGEQAAHVLHKAPLYTPAEELGTLVADELIARGALELLQPEPAAAG